MKRAVNHKASNIKMKRPNGFCAESARCLASPMLDTWMPKFRVHCFTLSLNTLLKCVEFWMMFTKLFLSYMYVL